MPEISITADPEPAREPVDGQGEVRRSFTLHREGGEPALNPKVHFEIITSGLSAAASYGVDYVLLNGDGQPRTDNYIVVPPGGATLTVQPLGDLEIEGTEEVKRSYLLKPL